MKAEIRIPVQGKPHLQRFYGKWSVRYAAVSDWSRIGKAIAWATGMNQVTRSKLNLSYNERRHG